MDYYNHFITEKKKELDKKVVELNECVGKFNLTHKENQWYTNSLNSCYFVTAISGGMLHAFGFDYKGEWKDEGLWGPVISDDILVRKTTTLEIELRLIEEAKKRGFKPGVRVLQKDVYGSLAVNAKIGKNAEFKYSDKTTLSHHNLTLGNYGIYNSGKWTKVIEPIQKMKFNGEDVEVNDDFIKIGNLSIRIDYLDFLNELSIQSKGKNQNVKTVGYVLNSGTTLYEEDIRALLNYIGTVKFYNNI